MTKAPPKCSTDPRPPTARHAEIYIGSGRFTGYRTDEPTLDGNGNVAPNFVYVGDMTDEEFGEAFEAQQPTA